MHWLPTQERKYLPLGSYPANLTIRLATRRITRSPATLGPIGPRSSTKASTAAQPQSRATSAAPVAPAGPET